MKLRQQLLISLAVLLLGGGVLRAQDNAETPLNLAGSTPKGR